MKKLLIITLICVAASICVNAQILRPVHWSHGFNKTGEKQGIILIKAIMDEGWHIYSIKQVDGGPVRTSFKFTSSKDYDIIGEVAEPKPVTKFEQTFNINVMYFENSVVFQQKVILKSPLPVIAGKLNYMVCNNQKCLPPEDVSFSIPIK